MKSERSSHDGNEQEAGRRARNVFVRGDEVVLKPTVERARDVMNFLEKNGAEWRTDPVFQSVIVADRRATKKLIKHYDCEDMTEDVRQFLASERVRIVGCHAFDGMLVYSASDDLMYHVDARSFLASPLPRFGLAYGFAGLGRPPHDGAPLEYDSVSAAIQAYKREATIVRRDWLAHERAKSSRSQ